MIGLVSCSAQKLSHPARAHLLYCSPLFKLSLEFAQARCHQTFILSAFHGLVELDQVLSPYDRKLGSKKEKQAWGQKVAASLLFRFSRDEAFMILAGNDYALPLAAALRTFDGYGPNGWTGHRGSIGTPLHGLTMGKRLAFLTNALRRYPTS